MKNKNIKRPTLNPMEVHEGWIENLKAEKRTMI